MITEKWLFQKPHLNLQCVMLEGWLVYIEGLLNFTVEKSLCLVHLCMYVCDMCVLCNTFLPKRSLFAV